MAIQQHPIPQNVTQYQFRLVGDMTLKQFLELAGGIVAAVIIYAFPLPVFFKWPLMFIAAAIGAGMAFLPIEGRPMSQWIVAFIRSIYQPTIYTWKKSTPADVGTPVSTTTPTPDLSVTKLAKAPEPSHITINRTTPTQGISAIPGSMAPPPPTSSTPGDTTPPPQEETKPLEGVRIPQTIFSTKPQGPLQVDKQTPLTSTPAPITPESSQPIAQPAGHQTPQTPTTPAPKPSLLPIPHPPQTPNTIVGMTLTPGGSILDSAIVEIIKDKNTVRATKSNKLGQFLFAKALEDGLYQITAEKQGYTFPTYSLNLTGQIVQPIELKAN